MAEIKPFRAFIYNNKKIKDLSKVVSPPYDVISETLQDKLYRSSPYNIVRLILGKTGPADSVADNRYTRASADFDKWLASGVMVRDPKESLYIYAERYKKGHKTVEQIGFLALLGLDDSRILPHENTLAAPKRDRLELMRATNANLEPIFVLYDERNHDITRILKRERQAARPFVDITLDGVRHRVWRLDGAKAIKKIVSLASRREMFIADGHHRFEVAKMFSEEIKTKDAGSALKDGAGCMMIYFAEADEKMLTILPAHRVVKDIRGLAKDAMIKKLEQFFRIKKSASLNAMMSRLQRDRRSPVLGMYAGAKDFYLLELKDGKAPDRVIADKPREWRRLHVSILHLFIFRHVLDISDDDENIEFVKDPDMAVSAVRSGKFKAVFFLNPTKVSQVIRIAKLGERMPRKATYFYPKPLSGLVINVF